MHNTPSYGWRFEYKDVGSVGLDAALKMAQVLKSVQSGVDRLRKKLGGAQTFGAYVLRVADAMKVKRFVFSSEYQDNNLRTVEPESAQQLIDGWFADFNAGREVQVA